ncbi:hypothetical protein B0H99_105277 [Planomicrobium soli]|uniref:Lipoprotein n=1 Tax=Planomicrobium soli TaxID=1176648 RepID=A0A2P8H2P9_9BACL|nr:DUF6612 family protein [Planomicrobium soli]PSL40499.1 hypothetical protein B0H99_105277 [Planomicrobium soli]
MKKWIMFVNGTILAFSLSACGQTTEPEVGNGAENGSASQLTAVEVYEDALKAAEEVGSLHADIATKQQMKMQPDGMAMDVSIDAGMDLTRNPEAFHHQSETSIVSEDIQNETPTFMEMYLTEEGLYLYEASMDTWLKLQDEAIEDFKLLADQQTADPAHQLKGLKSLSENFSLEETEGEYALILESSGEAFYPLLTEQLKKTFGQMEIGTPMKSEDMEIRSVRFEFQLDKKSLQVLSLKMDADFDVKIGEDLMSIQSQVDSVYKNYNEVAEIVLPDEVIEQAQTLE